ncbi:hypothetical protein DIJ64_14835 [Mycobacterium leprae]|uniref:Uncharacterized protein n=1 Tax=Mycobacterium leprae TaxID=1769 RepID=A0AAD0P906_MYCLR|nr:hypothetical protein [Mycobacterium leprae]AWV48891.1 hypothetical protein DIJ64_14835 [Mycobacterium leprae]
MSEHNPAGAPGASTDSAFTGNPERPRSASDVMSEIVTGLSEFSLLSKNAEQDASNVSAAITQRVNADTAAGGIRTRRWNQNIA